MRDIKGRMGLVCGNEDCKLSAYIAWAAPPSPEIYSPPEIGIVEKKTINVPQEVIRAAETMLKTSGLPGQRLCAKWILERAEKEGKE